MPLGNAAEEQNPPKSRNACTHQRFQPAEDQRRTPMKSESTASLYGGR